MFRTSVRLPADVWARLERSQIFLSIDPDHRDMLRVVIVSRKKRVVLVKRGSKGPGVVWLSLGGF